VRLASKAGKLIAICVPIFYTIEYPRCLTTLWASKAGYRSNFVFHWFLYSAPQVNGLVCKGSLEGSIVSSSITESFLRLLVLLSLMYVKVPA
jgi:hypothetical protein